MSSSAFTRVAPRLASGGISPVKPAAIYRHVDATPELAKLAGEIGWYQEEARKTVMLALQYKLEIGRRLLRAKSLLPHGQFLSWAQNEFGWTPRHLQRHLLLGENAPRVSCLPPDTSLRVALAAIKELRGEEKANPPLQRPLVADSATIHITGTLEARTVDKDKLLAEISRIAAELGGQKMRWTLR